MAKKGKSLAQRMKERTKRIDEAVDGKKPAAKKPPQKKRKP